MLSHFHLYGELRSSGVMGRRNGPSGLRDDDDDEWQVSRSKYQCKQFVANKPIIPVLHVK